MGPRQKHGPGQQERRRRRQRLQRRAKFVVPVAILLAAVVAIGGVWKVYSLARRRVSERSQSGQSGRIEDQRVLLSDVNRAVDQAGKGVLPAELVVESATLHGRDGALYLTGTIQNRSAKAYERLHIVFDAFDRHRNPAGVVEGDVIGVQAGKSASFELGPVSPQVRTVAVRMIQPPP